MSYLALARKWRPRTFSQLVGQDHVNQALINSLNQQRLHHAYLFTGTRGVGKTSVARLMAKALNCEQGVSAEPCLNCEACIAIEQGRFIDLIEVDAASKTRVEDTRDLLENIQYAPVNGRYKIYLIDEVHMLSQHSFNALLKTLEEPPEHVKFLLATTDSQKLPITVLSRCLQFNLKNLSIETICQQLQHIMADEQQDYELEALTLLAKAAQGSMRDALSLLDQVIASAAQKLTAQQVKSTLGYTQQDYALKLLHMLINQDAASIINISRQIAQEGGHFNYVLQELLDDLHQITLCQNLGEGHPLIAFTSEIKILANHLSPQDIQLFYHIALKGLDEMHLAPTLIMGFEMTLLRMLAFKPAETVKYPPLAHEAATKAIPPMPEPAPVEQNFFKEEPVATFELIPTPAPVPPTIEEQENWDTVLTKLSLSGLAQNAAENAQLINKEDNRMHLRVEKGHQSLFTPAITKRIEQALTDYYGQPTKITLNTDSPAQATPAQKRQQAQHTKRQNAVVSLENDAFLQQLQQEFSAELVKDSIVATEDLL